MSVSPNIGQLHLKHVYPGERMRRDGGWTWPWLLWAPCRNRRFKFQSPSSGVTRPQPGPGPAEVVRSQRVCPRQPAGGDGLGPGLRDLFRGRADLVHRVIFLITVDP